MCIGIWIWDLELGIGIGDWDWGLGIGDWDQGCGSGIEIGDWYWGLGTGGWDWRLGLGIGRMTNDNDYTLHFVLMRMKFLLFLHFMLELLLCFFEGCVVAGLMKN